MDEIAKIERTLRMLVLLSGNRAYTIPEMAERFDLSDRSIRRYIATFRKAGFVIEQEDGFYRIVKMDRAFRKISDLLHFSKEEAYLLTRAIHTISGDNLLKTNLENKLYALYDFDRVANTVVKFENSENVHILIKAIKGQKQVLLRNYRSANSNIERDRLVEPFDITTNYIAVWAFDPESRSNKLFKVSRIERVEILDNSFVFRSKHKKMFTDVFRVSSEKPIPVILKLDMRSYNLLVEEYPLAEKHCQRLDDNTWQFSAEVGGFAGVGRFVMGLIDEVKVVSPQGLRDYTNKKIKKRCN